MQNIKNLKIEIPEGCFKETAVIADTLIGVTRISMVECTEGEDMEDITSQVIEMEIFISKNDNKKQQILHHADKKCGTKNFGQAYGGEE